MEAVDYIKFIAALCLVLGMMGGLALLLKKLGLGHGPLVHGDKRRIRIIETLPLDARRKAVLFACDDAEHLVILGPAGETVVETNIKKRDV
ncbi:MAG: hypothetical protein WC989_04115 [Micavibrio sp.]